MIEKIFNKMGYIKLTEVNKMISAEHRKQREYEKQKEIEIRELKDTNMWQVAKNNSLLATQDKMFLEKVAFVESCKRKDLTIDNLTKSLESKIEETRALKGSFGGYTKEINKLKSKYLFALRILFNLTKKDETNMTCLKVDLQKYQKWAEKRKSKAEEEICQNK